MTWHPVTIQTWTPSVTADGRVVSLDLAEVHFRVRDVIAFLAAMGLSPPGRKVEGERVQYPISRERKHRGFSDGMVVVPNVWREAP